MLRFLVSLIRGVAQVRRYGCPVSVKFEIDEYMVYVRFYGATGIIPTLYVPTSERRHDWHSNTNVATKRAQAILVPDQPDQPVEREKRGGASADMRSKMQIRCALPWYYLFMYRRSPAVHRFLTTQKSRKQNRNPSRSRSRLCSKAMPSFLVKKVKKRKREERGKRKKKTRSRRWLPL